MKRILILFLLLQFCSVFAQEANDTTSKKSNRWDNLKIDGYVQAQYNHYYINDTLGSTPFDFANYSGGSMVGRYSNNRYTIRRGRINMSYTKDIAMASMQFDISERGVGAREAFIKVQDPWLKAFSVKVGLFNRPFGYEIEYSSKDRPSAERSRAIQTLFPNERDLGAMISFGMPKENFLHFLKFDFAMVNGNSINTETDQFKDYIGRIKIQNPLKSEKINFSLGASIYDGSVRHVYNVTQNNNEKRFIFDMKEMPDNTIGFDTVSSWESGIMGAAVSRKYLGFDAQLEIKSILGKTKIYSEYISGQQPAHVHKRVDPFTWNSMSPTGPSLGISYPIYNSILPYDPMLIASSARFYDIFIRQFEAFTFSFNHQIWKTKHEIVVKYDWYDPNTKVSGEDIEWKMYTDEWGNPVSFNYLSVADVKFTTLGIGWIYNLTPEVKLTVYYEKISNEKTKIMARSYDQVGQSIDLGYFPHPGFKTDIKDDVLTIRLQYKF